MYLNNLFFTTRYYYDSNIKKIEILETDSFKIQDIAEKIGVEVEELRATLRGERNLKDVCIIERFENIFLLSEVFWENRLVIEKEETTGNYNFFKNIGFDVCIDCELETHKERLNRLNKYIDWLISDPEQSDIFFDFLILENQLFKTEQEEIELLRRCYRVSYNERQFDNIEYFERFYFHVEEAIDAFNKAGKNMVVKQEELIKHLFKTKIDIITPYKKGKGCQRLEEEILFNADKIQEKKTISMRLNKNLLWDNYLDLLFEEKKTKEEAEFILLEHNPNFTRASLRKLLNRIRTNIEKERVEAGLPINEMKGLVRWN